MGDGEWVRVKRAGGTSRCEAVDVELEGKIKTKNLISNQISK